MDYITVSELFPNVTHFNSDDQFDSTSGLQPTLLINDYGDNDNITHIFGPKRDPLYVVIPITFIYMIIFISGVIGNISTCIVISKNKSMHTATNYYLFSLAISDFLLLLSGVPQEMYSIWSKYPYVFGELFCIIRGLTAETSANATVLTITAFTVERYVAICHPFLSHTMSKLSRAVRLIILIWMISICLAIPQALQFGVMSLGGVAQCVVTRIIIEHSFELSTFLFFFTPMTLITVLYVLIGLKLRSSTMVKRDNGVTMQRRIHMNSCRQQTSQGTRRVLKMLVAVVVAFFLCWAPFHAQRLVAIYGSGNDHLTIYVIMTYISGILYYLSTCINPLLYNIMSNKFRQAFKETLVKCCKISTRRYNKKRAYRVLSRGQRKRNYLQESGDYSGSSMRDESLYSTSTQKQSFDSMSCTERISGLKYPPLNGFNASDTTCSNLPSNPYNDGDIMLTTVKTIGDKLVNNMDNHDEFADVSNCQYQNECLYTKTTDDCIGNQNKTKDVLMTDKKTKEQNKNNCVSLKSLPAWQTSNNIKCCGSQSGKDININNQMKSSEHKANRETIENADVFKNINVKDLDKIALDDELSTYMAELRLREKT